MTSERVLSYWDRVAGQQTFHLGLGLLRAFYGVYWLYAASWKVPPDFGRVAGAGLWRWISEGAQFPTFSWYHGLLEGVIIPHFATLGYLVLLTELLIGFSLLLGAFTRLGTAIGLFMSVNITLTVANVPGETVLFYATLIGLHLLLGLTRSGRFWGLDARLARRLAGAATNGSRVARLLVRLT
ncbi:MAG: TQO small subunit DoxD [Anaerolineae bacterium]